MIINDRPTDQPDDKIELCPLEWLDIQIEDGHCVTRIKPEFRDDFREWDTAGQR